MPSPDASAGVDDDDAASYLTGGKCGGGQQRQAALLPRRVHHAQHSGLSARVHDAGGEPDAGLGGRASAADDAVGMS